MAHSDGDPRVARTRSTVIAAVHRLLRAEGPGAVTFGRVSRETGVSRTTLYRHWDGPSELVADAWTRLVPPGPAPPTDDLRADLVAMFVRVRDAVESTTMRRSLPTFLAAALDDPVISELHAAFVDDRRRPMVERLARARDAGEIAPDADLDLLVDLLSGPLFYRQLLRRQPTTDEQVAALVDAVLAVAGRSTPGFGEAEPTLRPIGRVVSELVDAAAAPRQGDEGAPDAWIEVRDDLVPAIADLPVGADVVVLTWLDRADRDVLLVHPRDDLDRPPESVFLTRSADRPNPVGLHRVRVLAVDGGRIRVGGLEAFDGTPVLDIKPVLGPIAER